MKKSDFIYSSVPGDGACFFHSIAYILTMEDHTNENDGERDYKVATSFAKGGQALSRKLRRDCVTWLQQNLDFTIAQLGRTVREEIQEEVDNCIATERCNNYKTIKEYLTYMRKHKSYAGQIEIYALSHKFGRSIRVYTEEKGKYKSSGLGFMIGSKSDPMDDIHIFHNSGNKNLASNEYHFDALFYKKKAKLPMNKDKKSKPKKSKPKKSKPKKSKPKKLKTIKKRPKTRKTVQRKQTRSTKLRKKPKQTKRRNVRRIP